MKVYLPVLFLLNTWAHAQSMDQLFLDFPLEHTYELTDSGKAVLIEKGEWIVPGGDSLETVKYSYHTDSIHVRLEYSWTTGQSAFGATDLRKFKAENGQTILVHSKYGGGRWVFDQYSLNTYAYKNGNFNSIELGLPSTHSPKDFAKTNLSDSLNHVINSLSTGYMLFPEKGKTDCLAYYIAPSSADLEQYLKENEIIYCFDGKKFRRQTPEE